MELIVSMRLIKEDLKINPRVGFLFDNASLLGAFSVDILACTADDDRSMSLRNAFVVPRRTSNCSSGTVS